MAVILDGEGDEAVGHLADLDVREPVVGLADRHERPGLLVAHREGQIREDRPPLPVPPLRPDHDDVEGVERPLDLEPLGAAAARRVWRLRLLDHQPLVAPGLGRVEEGVELLGARRRLDGRERLARREGERLERGAPGPERLVEEPLVFVGQAVEGDEGHGVRRHDVRGGLEPAQTLLEAEEGERPAVLHRENLAVEDVPPGRGRERGHDLGKLGGQLAPVPRVEPDVLVDLVELAPDAVVLVLDPERRAEAPDRVRRVRGRLGEHGVDGREVGEPRGLEASPARLERDRPEIGPVAVRGAHGLDRLAGRVGDGVLQRLLLHADPGLAEHRLDERADRARVHPPERLHEELGLGPGATGAVERLEARRYVRQRDGDRVGRRGAVPELGGDVARVGVAAPGGGDGLVGELRPRCLSAASSVAPPTDSVRPSPRGKGRPPRYVTASGRASSGSAWR